MAGMGDYQRRTQFFSQFHGVLQGRKAHVGLLGFFHGQHREVGSMGGDANTPIGGPGSELCAPILFPGKALDERKFIGGDALCQQIVQKGVVVSAFGGWRTRHAEADGHRKGDVGGGRFGHLFQ